jgi:hypothetical protein
MLHDNNKEYKRRLLDKYGEKFLIDMNRLLTDTNWTLTALADKYGFSREMARQYFRSIYRRRLYNPLRKLKKERFFYIDQGKEDAQL